MDWAVTEKTPTENAAPNNNNNNNNNINNNNIKTLNSLKKKKPN